MYVRLKFVSVTDLGLLILHASILASAFLFLESIPGLSINTMLS
jgi:hypothetical protein